jgi:hypothetical protein
VGESSEWTSIVNSVEESRTNFCKAVDRKMLFSDLCGIYMVTLNELKVVLMVSAPGRQSGAVTKTSVESVAQDDDFQEVERSNDTSQTWLRHGHGDYQSRERTTGEGGYQKMR